MKLIDIVCSRSGSLSNNWRPDATTALLVVSVLCLLATPVAAHEWQTTVENGEYELSINSDPAHPVVGIQTEFVARLSDSNVEQGDPHRLDNGGVVNKTVEVVITAPDGTTDHLEVQIPEDNAHFHFSYMFLQQGVYEIAVNATLDGGPVTFETRREVSLLPVNATGAQLTRLNQNVAALQASVATLQWIAGAAALFALLAMVGALFAVSRID